MKELAVGVDIEAIARFKGVSKNFLNRVFTKQELEYCQAKGKPEQHLAARFAAKEAVIKAFGWLGLEVHHKEIEILNKPNGAPYVNLKGHELEVRLSISHSQEFAIA
ncbi:holo-ACP synthase, partial [Candidatus Woesearchaeota archaeon]|nr:holo-ACP synthase [Candidatus Woesearchaeota archaeon]